MPLAASLTVLALLGLGAIVIRRR
ncbi:MAG: hypothetical protein DMG58_03200 [Acidobacteria bacterium]|nr:MAG: hypothetical protein DMG58_03200 [Acidobacteriota bacterium]